MEEYPFGPKEGLMILEGRADEVEQRLLRYYECAKVGEDPEMLRTAISCLAAFYELPFKQDLQRAEQYLQEGLRTLPDARSALGLVYFCYSTRSDPRRMIEEVARVRALKAKDTSEDLEFLYTAIAMGGLAHLALREEQEAISNLEELLGLATREWKWVVFGDEFNFVEQMAQRRLAVPTCKALIDIAREKVDEEYWIKFDQLLQSHVWDTDSGKV